jgi:hypothetical protein
MMIGIMGSLVLVKLTPHVFDEKAGLIAGLDFPPREARFHPEVRSSGAAILPE